MKVYFDTETKSLKSLTTVGTLNHLTTSASDIVCIGYRLGMDNLTRYWMPYRDMIIPQVFMEPHKHTFYAHNISFDKLVIDLLGKKHGFPSLPLSSCVDVQALVARYGFPLSLKHAGEALGVKLLKTSGHHLMKKISYPPFKFTEQDLREYVNYCENDVNSMCEIIKALPSDHLSEEEQLNWELTYRINRCGVPIDIKNARRIFKIVNRYIEEVSQDIPLITGGLVRTINQRDKLIEWAKGRGVDLPDFTKETVTNFLADKTLDEDVRYILELRQLIGLTSIQKYKKMINQYHKGRVHFSLVYHGSHTGREAGRDLQIQNLPKGNLKKPSQIKRELKKFQDLSILEGGGSPVQAAKNLIRPMIKTTTKATRLAVLDYSSIEHVLLVWLARELEKLEELREGADPYVNFASALYHVAMEQVSSHQRGFGKTAILGAGFMMSAARLYNTCIQWGLENVSMEECEDAINLFRFTYTRIVNLWKRLENNALKALSSPGTEFETHRCIFKMVADRNSNPWLSLKIPSGRTMYYCKPETVPSLYGQTITYLGVQPSTRKWSRLDFGPNKMIENIIQALGRDILMDGRGRIDKDYKIVASIHDENVVEVPNEDRERHWFRIKRMMEKPPKWGPDLPLRVSGYCERRYRKD